MFFIVTYFYWKTGVKKIIKNTIPKFPNAMGIEMVKQITKKWIDIPPYTWDILDVPCVII